MGETLDRTGRLTQDFSKSTNLKEDDESKAHGQDQPELGGERGVGVAAIVSVAANTQGCQVIDCEAERSGSSPALSHVQAALCHHLLGEKVFPNRWV